MTQYPITLKENPVLLDKVLQGIQRKLKGRLSWLDVAFGRAHKIVKYGGPSNKFTYPAAYVGNNEYISLLPNDNISNFSWFDIYDPQEIDDTMPGLPTYSFSGGLVFWYDLRRIYDDSTALYTEEVKEEILRVLTSPGLMPNGGRFNIIKIYERPENIYKGYSLEKIDVDKQFFMYPYASLRIDFKITTRELCYKSR